MTALLSLRSLEETILAQLQIKSEWTSTPWDSPVGVR